MSAFVGLPVAVTGVDSGDPLYRRYRKVVSDKMLWNSLWHEITELMLPNRADFVTKRAQGERRTRRLFDTTGLEAVDRLAAAISGTVTPNTVKWVDYELPRPKWAEHSSEADEWLAEASEVTYGSFQHSNFAAESYASYLEDIALGTKGMYIEEHPDFIHPLFQSVPLSQYAFTVGRDGLVNTVWRDCRMSVWEAVERWGEERVGERIAGIYKADPFKDVVIVHCIYKQGVPIKTRYQHHFPISSIYFDAESFHRIDEGGYWEWPFPVSRWSTTGVEIYGRGPGMLALPDVQTLNKADELSLKSWSQSLQPPYLYLHDGVVPSKPDLRPGHGTAVRSIDPPAIVPFPNAARIDHEQMKREDKRASVRRMFFMDQIQFVPERGKTPPTATEVQARLQIMLQILGPTLSRSEYEFLEPAVNRVFAINYRRGKIPPAPPIIRELARLNGGQILAQFVGPIAKAKRQSVLAGIQETFAFAGSAAAVKPDIVDVLDWDEGVRLAGSINGAPISIIRSREDVKQIRDQRIAQQNQQQQVEQSVQATQAAKNMQGVMDGATAA